MKEELKTKEQTEVVVTEVRRVVVTMGNTAVTGEVVPTTPTAHTEGARRRSVRINLRGAAVGTFPVSAPFPDVA